MLCQQVPPLAGPAPAPKKRKAEMQIEEVALPRKMPGGVALPKRMPKAIGMRKKMPKAQNTKGPPVFVAPAPKWEPMPAPTPKLKLISIATAGFVLYGSSSFKWELTQCPLPHRIPIVLFKYFEGVCWTHGSWPPAHVDMGSEPRFLKTV